MKMTTRRDQAAIVKTIGARMRDARELCNMSQSVAAKRFGYSNPSKLSKVEGATDTNSVPLWLIAQAAVIYEVSVDYLFGATDDWEIGARMTQEREISKWLFDAMEKSRQRDIVYLKRLHDKIDAMDGVVSSMLAASQEAKDAMDRFEEVNPEFQDMRAGGKLINSVDRVVDAAKSAKQKMVRFRCDCTMVAQDTHQLSLSL